MVEEQQTSFELSNDSSRESHLQAISDIHVSTWSGIIRKKKRLGDIAQVKRVDGNPPQYFVTSNGVDTFDSGRRKNIKNAINGDRKFSARFLNDQTIVVTPLGQ